MHCPPLDFLSFSLSCAFLASGIVLCMRELSPSTQLAYSKFALHQDATIPSKLGMQIIYLPSWIISFVLLVFVTLDLPFYGVHTVVIASFLHYNKRLLEVAYVHKYSGNISLSSATLISSSYAIFTIVTYWFSTFVSPEEYSQDQCRAGIALFIFGEGLNLYHHLILSNLRTHSPKQYKLPQGGLFSYVWCPHYLGEIISFIGITLISQHLYVALLQVSSSIYLCSRAYNTKKWYKEKFGLLPEKWCVIPWIF